MNKEEILKSILIIIQKVLLPLVLEKLGDRYKDEVYLVQIDEDLFKQLLDKHKIGIDDKILVTVYFQSLKQKGNLFQL